MTEQSIWDAFCYMDLLPCVLLGLVPPYFSFFQDFQILATLGYLRNKMQCSR
jgi:hypothetical protein